MKYKLSGGPLHGRWVELTSPGTLYITMHGWVGRYNVQNVWEGTRP